MTRRDIRNQVLGASIVSVLWIATLTFRNLSVPFHAEQWHDPATSDEDIHAMMPDLMINVLRPGRTSVTDVIHLLGPPYDDISDGEMWYALPMRDSAFDATYLIIVFNHSNLVTRSFIVDH